MRTHPEDGFLVMPEPAKRQNRLTAQRRTPRRPTGNDRLSGLPLELFLPIVRYTVDNTASKPLASLKSLSSCSKVIRAKCISSGLFRSLRVTFHRGSATIRGINQRLLIKAIPAYLIHSLTITEYIVGECPSELARLLQLLPQICVFRIKGNRQTESTFSWDSLPPLNCGRLISFNSLLHKTLSSPSKLRNLERLELIDCSITQVLIDLIATIRSYRHLVWTRSHILLKPNLLESIHCNVNIMYIEGTRFGNEIWMGQFLRSTRICESVEYMSLPATLFASIIGERRRKSPPLERVFPKLRTVHLLPHTSINLHSHQWRHVNWKIPFKTIVWRVPSFLNQDLTLKRDLLYFVSTLPNPRRS